MTKTNKAFTLIELLVVIAIIGIMAGAVMIMLNPKEKIDNTKENTIRTNLANINTQTGIYVSSGNDYTNVCSDPSVSRLINETKAMSGVTETQACDADADSYVFEVKFTNNGTEKFYCVDNTGVHTGTATKANATAKDCSA